MIDIKLMRRKNNIFGWLLAIPSLISIGVFIIYPFVFSFILSFTNWRFLPVNINFVGGENYKWLFSSAGYEFWNGLWTSLRFTVISTLLQTVLGFILAYVLYNMSKRVQGIYKVLLYLPVILPSAVVSVMWVFIYKNDGLLNILLGFFGIENPPVWLADSRYAMGAVIIANTWRFVGLTIIIYFVSMNALSKEIIESATIDGAGKVRILRSIILPLTWSSTKVNLLLSMIGGMKSFDLFYLLTNGGADTQVVGLFIFRTAFEYRVLSRAVTMSVVLTIFIGGLTFVVNFLSSRKKEDY